jgi:hypothetical protein
MRTHSTSSSLTAFLYELMRDHVVCGAVEGIMKSQEEIEAKSREQRAECRYELSNGYLAEYAEDVTERLIGHERRVQSDRLAYEMRRNDQLQGELIALKATLATERESLVAFLRSRINQQKSGLEIPHLSAETKANMQLEVDLAERYLERILEGGHRNNVLALGHMVNR